MRYSIIIPTKNEVESISSVVKGVRRIIGNKGEIVVIDEHSSDGTIEKAELVDRNLKIFQREGNGKGMAIKKAVEVFKGDIFLTIDSDATYDPNDIKTILMPIISEKVDVVIGSRFMGNREKNSINLLNLIGNKIINLIISLLYRSRITDCLSGLRALKAEVVRSLNLTAKGFEIEAELTTKCLEKGYNCVEVPINYYRRKNNTKSKLKPCSDGFCIMRKILGAFIFRHKRQEN